MTWPEIVPKKSNLKLNIKKNYSKLSVKKHLFFCQKYRLENDHRLTSNHSKNIVLKLTCENFFFQFFFQNLSNGHQW